MAVPQRIMQDFENQGLIVAPSEIYQKIMYSSAANDKKDSKELDSYHGGFSPRQIVSETQLNSTAVRTDTFASFRDPEGAPNRTLTDVKRRIGETASLLSSIKDDRTRLEERVKSQRQLREKGRNTSANLQQAMAEFQQQLNELKEEIHQGEIWREELSAKLDEEYDMREADRALVSSMLCDDI